MVESRHQPSNQPSGPSSGTGRAAPADAAPSSSVAVDVDFEHALGVSDPDQTLHTQGDHARVWDLASVSKPIAALGALIAVERGLVDLDDAVAVPSEVTAPVPEGATVRHLLAHTAGYAFDGQELLAGPGERRIYSNTGFEVLAAHVEEATGYDYPQWVEQTVVQELDLQDLDVSGSPAAGYRGSIRDLLVVGRELLDPTVISTELWREATAVQFEGLAGILPGYGRQKPNDWGLGFEIRDGKDPHWTGASSSSQTFGHFGQSGSFLWVDPQAQLTAAFLGAEPFGKTHIRVWPGVTDEIVSRFGAA